MNSGNIETGKYKGINREEIMEHISMNLEHARHVENERLSLNSIFSAIVAGVLAFTLGGDNSFVGFMSMTFLGFLCILSILLNKRWTDVFAAHTKVAQNLTKELYGDNMKLNDFYYHKHTPNTDNCSKFIAKLITIRTAHLFSWFYWIIFIMIAMLWLYYGVGILIYIAGIFM